MQTQTQMISVLFNLEKNRKETQFPSLWVLFVSYFFLQVTWNVRVDTTCQFKRIANVSVELLNKKVTRLTYRFV